MPVSPIMDKTEVLIELPTELPIEVPMELLATAPIALMKTMETMPVTPALTRTDEFPQVITIHEVMESTMEKE